MATLAFYDDLIIPAKNIIDRQNKQSYYYFKLRVKVNENKLVHVTFSLR